jgi:transposase InsO family protein
MTRLLTERRDIINKRRVQRLWQEEGLRNPLRKRRKRARGRSENSCAMKKGAPKKRECWDLTMDETHVCPQIAVEEHFYIALALLLLILARYSSNRMDPFRKVPQIFCL